MRILGLLILSVALLAGHGFAEEDQPSSAQPPEAQPAEPQQAAPGESAPKKPAPTKPAPEGVSKPKRPPILTLREASKQGVLGVVGRNPSSYKRVHLHLSNHTDEPLRIDIAGSYLVPKTGGRCQRLGLGPVVTPRGKKRPPRPTRRKPRIDDDPPGTVIVDLDPRGKTVVHVNTCCLDAGKPAPSKQTFRASWHELPEVRERVLRWWADNPQVPQYAVNTAIWQFREEVTVPSGNSRTMLRSGVAAHADTFYLLRDGELMARDPDGIERFLGTEIQGTHPTKGAVYAEAVGRERNALRQRVRELWRLVPTGEEPWRKIASIPEKLVLRNLFVAPSGEILVTTNEGLYRVDPAAKRFEELVATKSNLSVRFTKKGKVLVTLRRPSKEGYYQGGTLKGQGMPVCELWELDLKTSKRELVKAFWNVGQIRAGAAGIYALTPAGKLRRLTGRSFKNAPGQHAYERILRVGRTCVWLETKKGLAVAVDKSGRRRFEAGPRVRVLDVWDLDEHTDALVYLDGGTFTRVDPVHGERTPIVRERR